MDIYKDLRGHNKSENDSTCFEITMGQTISGGLNITWAFASVRCDTTQRKLGMFVELTFLRPCSAKNTHNYLLKVCYSVIGQSCLNVQVIFYSWWTKACLKKDNKTKFVVCAIDTIFNFKGKQKSQTVSCIVPCISRHPIFPTVRVSHSVMGVY